MGAVTADVCYPGCPWTICEGPAGQYPVANPGCDDGGGAGSPVAPNPVTGDCGGGYRFDETGFCVPTYAGMVPNVPPSGGPVAHSGFPWPGVNMPFLPESLIAWLMKYGPWIVGGLAVVWLLGGSDGRRR
jgi:hypothetical protein